MYFAHTSSVGGEENWEPLSEHLTRVAERAAKFAGVWGQEQEAYLAGLLHDLGKYGDPFQARLRGIGKGLDHWSMGGWLALERYGESEAAHIAAAIQGHHVGLQDGFWKRVRSSLDPEHVAAGKLTPTDADSARLLERFSRDGLQLPAWVPELRSSKALAAMTDLRMLFSALVDSDYLCTEAYARGPGEGSSTEYRFRSPGPELQAERALEATLAYIQARAATVRKGGGADATLLQLRSDLLTACRCSASWEPGLFTLSAPTGSGKTLALLAFALDHAARHGLRRIVLALPYLSLLEQTVEVYRQVLADFGPEYVLEHHSLADPYRSRERGGSDSDTESLRARELTENWDAPIVVTTSVQLLESLFAHRPRSCRKLHRLAESIVLLDEVQTLPSELAPPTLGALARLQARFGASVVFATATQPAFDQLNTTIEKLGGHAWQPREIAPLGETRLFGRLRRTRVVWRIDEPCSFETVAAELVDIPQVLAIVNLKRHARRLTELLGTLLGGRPSGLLHLSTNLCPAHRQQVFAEVQRRLDCGEPCRLIATQCVEAGVDLDFPVVYRAMAPLEAIAQAAGRCNRHGRLGPEGGEVVVFQPDDPDGLYPGEAYGQAAEITATLLRASGTLDLDAPAVFRQYYRKLYATTGIEDRDSELIRGIKAQDFPRVDREYQLIPDGTIEVLVPYNLATFRALDAELRTVGRLTRDWIRRARPHSISLFPPNPRGPTVAYLNPAPLGRDRDGRLREADDWFTWVGEGQYDRELLGFLGAEDVWIA